MGLFAGDDIDFVVSHLRDLRVHFHLKKAYNRELRDYVSEGLISAIHLPFTELEWCHLCMREGEYYIGGCCGSSGYTQDYMNSVFRETGWAKADDFITICESLKAHGDEPFRKKPKKMLTSASLRELHPYDRMAYLWHLTRNLLVIEPFQEKGERRTDLAWHLRSAAKSIQALDWHLLVEGLFDRGKEATTQDKADMTLAVAKTLPSLRVVMDRLHELASAPFEGFAVVDKNNEPLHDGRGPCIYETEKEAKSVLKRSKDFRKSYRPEDFPECRIVPVRISLENGLELK